jgi:TPR repeat protein
VLLYRLAAGQGHTGAQYKLGNMFASGEIVVQDKTEAVRLYRLAAGQGHAEAQFKLGYMFANGEGVKQDYTEAVRFYRLAAAQGLAEAQYNLGLCLTDRKDDEESELLLISAAEQGHVKAQLNLGLKYTNGTRVAQDNEKAEKFMKLAAEQGDDTAQTELGCMYQIGRCVPKNDMEAKRWYRLAEAQGNPEAQNFLGVMLLREPNISQPLYDEAAGLFRKAATRNEHADLNLIYMLLDGKCECCSELEKKTLSAIHEAKIQGHTQSNLEFLWLFRNEPWQYKLPELK